MVAPVALAVGAVTDVVKSLTALPGAVRGFVDALNPAVGERFDYALRGLNATIGFGLEPILLTATRIVEEFSGALSEGMDALREPIAKVASVFQTALRPALEAVRNALAAVGDAFDALEPLLPLLGTVMEGIMAIGNVLTTIFGRVLVELIKSLMPAGEALTDATQAVAIAFVKLAEATLNYVAFLLRLVGLEKAMVPILEALASGRPPAKGREGMPSGFSLGGLEDVYKKRLLAAAQAGGGQAVDALQLDVMKDIRELCEKMLDKLVGPRVDPEVAAASQKGFAEFGERILGMKFFWSEAEMRELANKRNEG
jgi:hypothetical protein